MRNFRLKLDVHPQLAKLFKGFPTEQLAKDAPIGAMLKNSIRLSCFSDHTILSIYSLTQDILSLSENVSSFLPFQLG